MRQFPPASALARARLRAAARRTLTAAVFIAAASAVGCGPFVQRATITPVPVADTAPIPIDDSPPEQGGAQLVIRAAGSTLEVTGADLVTGSHVMRFEDWSGAFVTDAASRRDRPSGRLTLDVDLTTLRTDSSVESFLKYDLLEVDKHPRGRLDVVLRPDDGEHAAEGRVELHGVERAIRFTARVRPDGDGYRIDAIFDMSRLAFDIRRRDQWDVLINEDFRVVLGLSARAERVTVTVDPPDLNR